MSEIKLEDLPKSKEFMKQVLIADKLTKKTGLEHGFIFCKPKNDIVIDNICEGTNCQIDIKGNKCGNDNNSFHTHPQHKYSNHSGNDIVHTLEDIKIINKPQIMCVSGSEASYVRCDKLGLDSINSNTEIISYQIDEFEYSDTDLMLFDAKSKFIEFDKITKEIEFNGGHNDIASTSTKRWEKEQKKRGLD